MQIAPGLVGEALKKLPSKSESKCTGHVLLFFRLTDLFVRHFIQSTPDQVRPSAEIDHTTRQAFVHRHIGFSSKRVSGMKPCPVPSKSLLVSKCFGKGLPQCDTAILNSVVCIHLQIT